jgi:hypothetical protein
MPTKADVSATLAGGAAGLMLLQSVQWDKIPCGEGVKVSVALLLILAGCLLYRKTPPAPPPMP